MNVRRFAPLVVFAMVCVVLGSASAQTAPAASTPLTPEEREFALKQYETTRDNFLKSISGLSQKQWTFKPAPDRWSVAEMAEHITVAESLIMGLIQKQLMTLPAAWQKQPEVGHPIPPRSSFCLRFHRRHHHAMGWNSRREFC